MLDLILLGIAIFVMYWRTIGYSYIIDDNVERDGYLYIVPLTAPTATKDEKTGKITPCTFDRKPSGWYRLFMIGMHTVNTYVIFLLWGWWPAVLFAMHPAAVWGTAWVTGNYYATTAYFCLIAYYLVHTFPTSWLAGAVAMCLYAAALNSTIEALAFPFVLMAIGNVWGIAMLFPLIMFLRGKRFTTGMKIREGFISEERIKGFSPRRLILMVKVIGKYVATTIFPERLGFFGPFGANIHDNQEVYDRMHSADKEFYTSLALCAALFFGGLMIHPVGTLWFFGFIALHSQWKVMGQFFALRYIYIALPGFCVVVGTALAAHPIALAVLATFYGVRSHIHIFAFRNVESIYENDLETWPEHAQVWNNMAQCFMRENSAGHSLPNWKLNLMAAYILKSEQMNPKAWEINMNVACFYAIIGQWQKVIEYTDKAIDLLKPLADKPCAPLQQLIAQRERIIKQAEEATKPTGAQTSPVEPQKAGVDYGTGTESESSVKPRGNSELTGREARA